MNYKVHSLTIFMANPFSFSQAVFFKKREMATPINQEARILDFVARPSLPRKYILSMRTPFIFVHTTRTTIPRHIKQNFCLYIYSPRISNDMELASLATMTLDDGTLRHQK